MKSMYTDLFFAPVGSKVTYLDENGYDRDKEYARDTGLKKGEVYTLSGMEIGGSHATLWLEEFPGKSFNTVMFKVKPYPTTTNKWMAPYLI